MWNDAKYFLQVGQYLYKKDEFGIFSIRVKIEKVVGGKAYAKSNIVFRSALMYSNDFGAVAKRLKYNENWRLETPAIKKEFLES